MLKNKTSRALIGIMGALVIFGIIIAKAYYGNVNASVDPRVAEARELYKMYNTYAQASQFDSVFYLLDQIESVYSAIPHYQDSYEIGVLYNNRAATNLTLALYSPVFNEGGAGQDSLMQEAESASIKAIEIYEKWLSKYASMEESELESYLSATFLKGLETHSAEEIKSFLNMRLDELLDAQIETPRRLSVSYTNMGIIHRHREEYVLAAEKYQKALDLWDQNLTAENNLRALMGQDPRKQSLIKKLFPPERK
jgi:tetratricopeptide (TPR) repeat protein